MARIKQVMLALRVTRKTAHAMIGTQRFKLFLTSGEQLMRINLMADVKDKLVRRTVKRPAARLSALRRPNWTPDGLPDAKPYR